MDSNHTIKPDVGILQWFHISDFEAVESTIKDLNSLNIKSIRTGFSWADWYTPEGRSWYDWLLPRLAKEFEVLPCFLYTPPSIGETPRTSSPPKNLQAYADDLDLIIDRYGKYFEYIELWNEPNNKSEWNFTLDRGWKKFAEMITKAAFWARHKGKKTVLGGMSPIDASWLRLMFNYGVMDHIDVVGIHGFPDVFDVQWEGWEENILRVKDVLTEHQSEAKIWITEVGFSTWQFDELKQVRQFAELLNLPVEKVYWYTLNDLAVDRETVDGFHLDEREYFFGLKDLQGQPKLLYRLWKNHGSGEVKNKLKFLSNGTNGRYHSNGTKPVLITGGAGFIGTNLAAHYLQQGIPVHIYDNLSRKDVEKNYLWLKETFGSRVHLEIADIRNDHKVLQSVRQSDKIFHFAGQVAVTTSVNHPKQDFEINTTGTLNILEAIRKLESPPSLFFTSTNKVYGALQGLVLDLINNKYQPIDNEIRKNGIGEKWPLSFHSPYGCSKGAADQYVSDYARIYDIPAVTFRMSCIYGPHQMGTEDQGWVANFASKIMLDQLVNIFGDGKQVRDILYIEDLINAFLLASKHIDQLHGEIFNIGGGPENAVSLRQVISNLESMHGEVINLSFDEWRPGDQRYYVSDIRKFARATGWYPKVNYRQGLQNLYDWMLEFSEKSLIES